MMNLTYPQIALVAVMIAGLLGAHYLGAVSVETALVGAFTAALAGFASLGQRPPPAPPGAP